MNGGWSAWKPWTACSKTCGEGLQFTHRYCNNPKPQFGGKPCVGPSSNTRTCLLESCAGILQIVTLISVNFIEFLDLCIIQSTNRLATVSAVGTKWANQTPNQSVNELESECNQATLILPQNFRKCSLTLYNPYHLQRIRYKSFVYRGTDCLVKPSSHLHRNHNRNRMER